MIEEKRYELVAQVLAGKSYVEVAISNGLNPEQLYKWVRKYKELGYNGLMNLKKGHPVQDFGYTSRCCFFCENKNFNLIFEMFCNFKKYNCLSFMIGMGRINRYESCNHLLITKKN